MKGMGLGSKRGIVVLLLREIYISIGGAPGFYALNMFSKPGLFPIQDGTWSPQNMSPSVSPRESDEHAFRVGIQR